MRNIKKNLFIGLMAFGLVSVANAQSVHYTMNYNDPYDIRPLKVNLLLLTLDGYGINSGLGAGLHGQYILGKTLTLEAIVAKCKINFCRLPVIHFRYNGLW